MAGGGRSTWVDTHTHTQGEVDLLLDFRASGGDDNPAHKRRLQPPSWSIGFWGLTLAYPATWLLGMSASILISVN